MLGLSSGKLIGAAVLALAFVALSASNYFLFQWWQAERDAATVAGEALADTARDAQACTDGVTALEITAAEQAASAASAVQTAQAQAETYRKRAQRQMQTAPSVPGDDCKSSAQRFDRWLSDRQLAQQ